MIYLTRDCIDLKNTSHPEDGFRSGAEVIFLGKVRDHSRGAGGQCFRHPGENAAFSSSQKKVLFLEYEAYESMAENLIGSFIHEARARWKIDDVKVLHRLGKVGLGEIAVLIEVQSAHRDEAYQASRFLIESIKQQVPIWKKEYFEDGTNEWSLCKHGNSIPVS